MKRQPGTAELASMNLSANMTSGIGQPVRRKEDFRLLTGRGSFADDIHLPELAHAVIVRSPHAHAHIESIDKAAALASPGVLKVLTGHPPLPIISARPPRRLVEVARTKNKPSQNAVVSTTAIATNQPDATGSTR